MTTGVGQVGKIQARPLLRSFVVPWRKYQTMPAEGVDAPSRTHETKESAAEHAPGLPEKNVKKSIPTLSNPTLWTFNEQRHLADQAGPHTDVRLSDGKTAFSWAVRKGLPVPGAKSLAIRQSDHSPGYMGWSGTIESGYGKGEVTSSRLGKAKVLSSTLDKIKVALLDTKNPQRLTFIKTPRYGPDAWLILNQTPTVESRTDVPVVKPALKRGSSDLSHYLSDRFILSAKIDGAHCTVNMGDTVDVFSHRPSVDGSLIDHTFLVGAEDIKVPAGLQGTKVRAEVFGVKDDKPLVIGELGGLLNSSPSKALQRVEEEGIRMYVAPFQVIQYKGESYAGRPYAEHLKAIREITSRLPGNWIAPDVAVTRAQKQKMLDAIKAGKHPLTREGVVAWAANDVASTPHKVKFVDHHQVYVVDVFPVESKGRVLPKAGGFSYSLKPGGPAVGRVGTGFSEALRNEMWQERARLRGRKVIVNSAEQFASGAFRAPVFEAFHP